METDHQPPEIEISAEPMQELATAAPSPDPPPVDTRGPPAAAATNLPKRQRRPSVRLGEIGGDKGYETLQRRPNKTWRYHKDPSLAAKTSKIRPLTNLVNGGGDGGESSHQDSVEHTENFDGFSHRKPKIKKPAKRARSNWNNFDGSLDNGGGAAIIESGNFPAEGNENNKDEFRDFEVEGSGSPLQKEQQSPINYTENMGLHFWDQQRRRNRGSNGLHHHNEVDSPEKRSEGIVGVKEWLRGLGLERYGPVFEIHEVDEEVLAMLTLEDLKDMGINAVGSRRKMYSSILKLRKVQS